MIVKEITIEMSKKLFLSLLPLMALAMAGCSRGNGGASSQTSSSKGGSSGGESSQRESSQDDSSEEDTSGDESSGEAGAYTYKATNLPEWITNDGCVIFAWVWSPSDEGSWKSCVYEPDVEKPSYVSVSVDEELTGFLLARCQGETTEPDWHHTEDSAGRVYNKTADMACTAGTYEYDGSSWVEYTPSAA